MKFIRLCTYLLATLILAPHFVARADAQSPESIELTRTRGTSLEAEQRNPPEKNTSVKPLKGVNPAGVLTLDFPGGSIASFLSVAAKADPNGFNLIAEKADLNVDLPPFTVRNASPSVLASALDELLHPKGYLISFGQRNPPPNSSPVFVLLKLDRDHVNNESLHFMSFQLAQHLELQSVDDIVSALRQAWELDPTHLPDAMRIKYHPATTTLLVVAPNQAINIVVNVLGQLRSTRPSPPSKPASPTSVNP